VIGRAKSEVGKEREVRVHGEQRGEAKRQETMDR